MKIYFEDGDLDVMSFYKNYFDTNAYIVDAKDGVSSCINSAKYIQQISKDATIYTNCLELVSNQFAWNKEIQVPEVFIRHKDTGEFIRIDKGTERELKEGHNLARLYLAGEFDSITDALENPPRFGFNR